MLPKIFHASWNQQPKGLWAFKTGSWFIWWIDISEVLEFLEVTQVLPPNYYYLPLGYRGMYGVDISK